MSRYLKVIALVGSFAMVAAACGGDGDDRGGEEPGVVRLATGALADIYIPQTRAPQEFGDLFNLSTDDQVTLFENGASTQTVISGQIDVGFGGIEAGVRGAQVGTDIQVFCPYQKDSTEHLVGLTDRITDLDQITDPDIRVAVESAGGFLNLIMNLVFLERGLGITTDDLTNTVILEEGSLRLQALADRKVDVGSLDLFEQAELKEALGEDAVTVLSVVAEDTEFISQVLYSRRDWLEENEDLAARYCAAVLYSNRLASSDFDEFLRMLNKYAAEEVDEEVARTNWEFVREHEVFPYDADILNEDNVRQQFEVMADTDVIPEAFRNFPYDDLVNTEILELAVQYAGGPVTAEDIEAGNVPEPNCC